MITLQRPDPKIRTLFGESMDVRDGDLLRPSQFAMGFSFGERRIVFHFFSQQCIETKYYDWFNDKGPGDGRRMPERIYDAADAEMTALLRAGFLVKSDLDEAARYFKIMDLLRATERKRPGKNGYTILPTTACNARCFYCYQEGIRFETMTEEMADKTVEYIARTRREKEPVRLHWFGGEPLVGEHIIDRICTALRDRDIPYRSGMISNGSLFTPEMVKKAKELWHLRSIQITLEGREEEYCLRKRYVSFPGSPYRAVLHNIHLLLQEGIRVMVRLNADEDNCEDLRLLIRELGEEFAGERGLSAYTHSPFLASVEERKDPDEYDAIYRKIRELNEAWGTLRRTDAEEAANAADEESRGEKRAEAFFDRKGRTKRHYCMADNPDSGLVITPDGRFHRCEHSGALPSVGHVDEGVTKMDVIAFDRARMERCRECALLPCCTPFSSCPTIFPDCRREILELERIHMRSFEEQRKLPPITIVENGRTVRVTEPSREFAERHTKDLAAPYGKPDVTRAWSQKEA